MIRRFCFTAMLVTLGLAAGPGQALGAANQNPRLTAINGNFEDACGLARSSGGQLYVSSYYHDTIEALGSSTIEREDPNDGPCGLALDSEGDLYVNNWRGDVVKYAAGELASGRDKVIDPGPATGVAVDPATGNVYVDRRTYIAEYAAPVEPGNEPVKTIGLDNSASYYGVAVSDYPATAGYIYVANAADEMVEVYDPTTSLSTPVATIDGSATPQAGFHHLTDAELAVDNNPTSPTYGHIYVLDNIGYAYSERPEGVFDEFNAAGDYRGEIKGFVDAEPSGIAIEGASGDVYVTSGNSEGSQIFVYGPTAPARTLTVTKTGEGAGTVSTPPEGISCGTACAAEYEEEETVTLFANPDVHSAFTGWTVIGPGAEPCPGTGSCTVQLIGGDQVTANFEALPQQTLNVSVIGEGEVVSKPAGINCSAGSGACSEHFNEESTVILSALPAPHSRFLAWNGCDSEPSPGKCEVTMGERRSVEAHFEPIPQQTLIITASGAGTVISEPVGIECTAGTGSCSEHFDEASVVTLTATPVLHNELVSWSGCRAEPSSTQCEVAMSKAESVSAMFAPIHHHLTVTVVGEGSVSADHGAIADCTTAGGSCSGSYLETEPVTLIATPAAGSGFAGFSGGCGGTGPCQFTLNADLAVTANFAALELQRPEELPPGRLSLGRFIVKITTATLAVNISGPGTVGLAGKYLNHSSTVASSSGSLTLNLALNGAGLRVLRKTKTHKLKVAVTLTFTPADGATPAVVTEAVTFKGSGRAARGTRTKRPRR